MVSFTRSQSRLRIKKIPGAGAAPKQAGSKTLFKFNFVRFSIGGAGVGVGASPLEQLWLQPKKSSSGSTKLMKRTFSAIKNVKKT